MKKNLVIVESPAKAKTLTKILGNKYNVKASLGHIRDLPKSRLGVDVEKSFTPKYVVPRDKQKTVQDLKKAAAGAAAVYLATDPDREGEAISWHLAEVTKGDDIPYRRVVFHEITQEAVERAFKHPGDLNMQLVDAQQARRILDRLVGYKISPLLWKNVRRGLSAGRVQSVALKIVVDREREIQNFVPKEYWTIEAELTRKDAKGDSTFRADLVGYADGTKVEVKTREQAEDIASELEQADYSVLKVKTKNVSRHPTPPFITSTLQQEAWRKLRFTADFTMRVAQQLYEGLPVGEEGTVGLITYMRTDSTHVARSAITETRQLISERYGPEYLPAHARSFASVRGAQEAHEAIRPTRIGRDPQMIKQYLTTSQAQLYELIWKRMVASQMASATFENTTVDIKATRLVSKNNYLLRATSSINTFPGFIVLYTEGTDQTDKDYRRSSAIPHLEKGDLLKLLGLFPEQHFTQPPSRFTEATLIKMLEQLGIGRPSTYAPILATIRERGYVSKNRGSFQPTELGFVVNDLLVKHFPDIIDAEFTARLEDELDKIASERMDWVSVVQDFYNPFEKDLEKASTTMDKVKLADEETDEVCPECGKPMVVKHGRFGRFLACSGYPECKTTKSFQVKTGAKCPECGSDLIERMSKKKRRFYGCSNYPKCQFATNLKPVPRPCPKCGGLLTQYRKNGVKCTKCDYKGKLAEAEAETAAGQPS